MRRLAFPFHLPPRARPGFSPPARAALAVLAALCLLLAGSVAPARSYAPAPVTTPRYLVLIVLDGGRPDYFHVTPLPHLDALIAHGVVYTQAVDGILEAETPAGHTTIATGSTPARDGILGFNWAQNDHDYSLFSPTVVQSGAMERIMSAAHVPTIAGLYKARFPGAKVVAVSGHKYYAADPLGGPQADAIMYYQGDARGRYVPVAVAGHVPPPAVLNAPGMIFPSAKPAPGVDDESATRLALSSFAVMHQRITLINYPEFDWPLGHVDGGNKDRAALITLMRDFDADLGRIENALAAAHVLSQTLFAVTADHGMEPVTRFIPYTVITGAVARAGTTAPSIAYNGAAYVWLKDGSKGQAVAQNILHADPGIEATYYLATTPGRTHYALAGGQLVSDEVVAAHQYLLGTLINGHEPSVVAFARRGQTFSSSASHWKADHGGPNWASQHIPLLLSGPGIRSGVVINTPAQLEDVAPTVLEDMGVTSTGMQGHVLTDALQGTVPAAQQARTAEISQLTPLVNALFMQNKAEYQR